jgi:hypothetical protein
MFQLRPSQHRFGGINHGLLLLARREIQVAVIAAAHLLDGRPFNESDRDRLLAAHARLVKLLEVVHD